MKLGISLSGGGVRATVFHLGVLQRLAESGRWGGISHLSTVSGGSLCPALILAVANGIWPDAGTFLQECLPKARERLTSFSIMGAYLRALATQPWLLMHGRAHIVGRILKKHWGLTLSLKDLPREPRWTINCTTYETGKNWRFSWKRMGDYLTGYVLEPDFPVAQAVAASAGFPGGIGPLKLSTAGLKWVHYQPGSRTETEPTRPLHRHFHLWDGGVYENLGSEALVKPGGGLREGVDFYIASDAGRPLRHEFKRFAWFPLPRYLPPLRLLDCAMDQVRAVRARCLMETLNANGQCQGLYLQIGQTREQIFCQPRDAPSNGSERESLKPTSHADATAAFPTTLRRLAGGEYDHIFSHGYDVADATLEARAARQFPRK